MTRKAKAVRRGTGRAKSGNLASGPTLRLLPPFDSGEHAFWVCGPDEGFGIEVCLGDEAVDGDLQINDRSEHAALEALARELGEEAFDRVEPGC